MRASNWRQILLVFCYGSFRSETINYLHSRWSSPAERDRCRSRQVAGDRIHSSSPGVISYGKAFRLENHTGWPNTLTWRWFLLTTTLNVKWRGFSFYHIYENARENFRRVINIDFFLNPSESARLGPSKNKKKNVSLNILAFTMAEW